MKLQEFLKTWDGIVKENRFHRVVIGGLLVSNILAALAAFRVEHSVILVPPGLNKEVEITRNKASSDFKQAWGLFLADLLGNAHPGTVDFIAQTLSPILSASIYREVMDTLAKQTEEIKREHVSLSFQPSETLYEVETDKVFITGKLKEQAPGSKPVESIRTYEFIVDLSNYRPVVRHIDAYPGQPKTLETLEKERSNHGQS